MQFIIVCLDYNVNIIPNVQHASWIALDEVVIVGYCQRLFLWMAIGWFFISLAITGLCKLFD
jgi:hypothetical protein